MNHTVAKAATLVGAILLALSAHAEEPLIFKPSDWEFQGRNFSFISIQTTTAPIVITQSMDSDPLDNLVTIYPDGSVKFGPEYKGDQAATDFWSTMAKVFPQFLCEPEKLPESKP